jgi:hypothetical protein
MTQEVAVMNKVGRETAEAGSVVQGWKGEKGGKVGS